MLQYGLEKEDDEEVLDVQNEGVAQSNVVVPRRMDEGFGKDDTVVGSGCTKEDFVMKTQVGVMDEDNGIDGVIGMNVGIGMDEAFGMDECIGRDARTGKD